MDLTASPLFAGLEPGEWDDILGRMRTRHYTTGEHICRAGDASDRMYLIKEGVVEVAIGEATGRIIGHLRRGDIFGEMGLLSDEPRSASIVAALPTLTLELDRATFTDIINRYPSILLNISRVLVERQKRSLRSLARPRRGEFVLLMIGRGSESLAQDIIMLCREACPRGVTVVDLSGALELDRIAPPDRAIDSLVAILDQLPSSSGPIISVCYSDHPDLALLIRYMDRLALLGAVEDVHAASASCAGSRRTVDVFLIGAQTSSSVGGFRTVRVLGSANSGIDLGWIARHLTRTKLGLALGAGGAKGFAHVGVLGALQRAGYVVDFVAGSSIGGLIGGLMGLGLDADALDVQLKRAWSPEHVELLTILSPEGMSAGLERVLETVREIFGDRMMSDLSLPLRILSADLEEGQPVPLDDWTVYEAIRAGLSIPGLALPYRHGSQRLVDAVCLTPVPASFVRDMGADIVVAVNLLSRPALSAWPSEAPPRPTYRKKTAHKVDPVIETLMMLQIDTSIRNASQADIVLTPRFTASGWRDFYLSEQFREAGHAVAQAELARLFEVARPVVLS
jgi:NTE family protein